jgi:hypothetical protein
MDIDVFVLFTIGLVYRELKKASSRAQNPLEASSWNLLKIQFDNQRQTVEVGLGWLALGNDMSLS